MDYLIKLYINIKLAKVLLGVIAVVYFVVWFAWLWPFPYPGVSWYGDPWANFRQWIVFTIVCGIFLAVILSFHNKWSRDAKKEEAKRYGSPTVVVETKKKNSIDEMIKKAAKEAAEEVAEEKKEGGEG